MKYQLIGSALAASVVLSACAFAPHADETSQPVSADYAASGAGIDIRAYVYGSRTVFELDATAPFVTVKDAGGQSVEFEKVGRHYRLSRQLDDFTVWVNGRRVNFAAVSTTRVFSSNAASPLPPAAVKITASAAPNSNPSDMDVLSLLRLSERQLRDVRAVIEGSDKSAALKEAELWLINSRLDEIEARLVSASAAVVRVSFPSNSVAFKPDPKVAKVLIDSAKLANQVNLSGHTDSQVAGPLDAKIAQGRAMAARKFLIDNGVDSKRITVASKAEGSFLAPNSTDKGRAVNRRVELEFVNSRIAALSLRVVELAAR